MRRAKGVVRGVVGHTPWRKIFPLTTNVERPSTAPWSRPKKKAGKNVTGTIDSFAAFVQKKTEQIRKQYPCESVEYSVEIAEGQVKLKAKAKT